MPKKKHEKKHDHVAAVGLNVVVDDAEVRYEPGDPVDVEHVEQWMIDEGTVECHGDCHTKPVSDDESDAETSADVEGSESADESGSDAQIDVHVDALDAAAAAPVIVDAIHNGSEA